MVKISGRLNVEHLASKIEAMTTGDNRLCWCSVLQSTAVQPYFIVTGLLYSSASLEHKHTMNLFILSQYSSWT